MAIVYRLIKNSELTWLELDSNFSFLDDKIDQVAAQTGSSEIVRVTPQVFLPAEEGQARANIKAASVDQVVDLSDRVDFLETYNPVMYTPQILLPQEQQTARDNIDSLGTSPNGTDKLIGTNDKINDSYLPDSLFGQMKWGGNFNENGIISATADYPSLQGTNISNLDTVQYKGVYFIAAFSTDTVYALHGVDYNNGDWAAANGNINGFNKADNSDAVTSVAGKRGAVTLDTNDIQGLATALAGKANTSGNYPNLTVGNANLWGGAEYSNSVTFNIGSFLVYDPSDYCYHPADVSVVKGVLGINDKADKDGGNITNVAQWKTTLGIDVCLAYKGQQSNNSNANNLPNGIYFNTTGNGTNNSNWVYQYGTLIQYPSEDGFQLRFFINHDGELTIRSQWQNSFHPDRKMWDSINLPQSNISNFTQAYNERVTQFNTTYTTSVYTFSLLLGNGTTKSTNLQVSVTYFTINSSGVLELNSTVRSQLAEIGNKRTYSLSEIGNNDYIKESAITDSFSISGFEVVVYNASTSQFESPLSGSNYRNTFMSICGLRMDDRVFLKGLVETSADLSSLINDGKFHLCMAYVNTGSIYTGTIEWMSSQDIYGHRKGATSTEVKEVIKIADIVSPNSVFVNPKNI